MEGKELKKSKEQWINNIIRKQEEQYLINKQKYLKNCKCKRFRHDRSFGYFNNVDFDYDEF